MVELKLAKVHGTLELEGLGMSLFIHLLVIRDVFLKNVKKLSEGFIIQGRTSLTKR